MNGPILALIIGFTGIGSVAMWGYLHDKAEERRWKKYDKIFAEDEEYQQICSEMQELKKYYDKGRELKEQIRKANEEAEYFPLNHCLSSIAELKVEFLKVSENYYRYEKLLDKRNTIIYKVKEQIWGDPYYF